VLKPWPVVFLVDYVLQSNPWPVWLQNWIVVLPGASSPNYLIAWTVGATLILYLLSWAAGAGSNFLGVSLGQRMAYDLAADLLARLQQLSLRFHANSRVGDNIRRLTADAACFATVLKDALIPLLMALLSLVIMFTILWNIHPGLTLLALAVVPFMALVLHLYAKPMLEKSALQQEMEAQVYAEVEQTLSAIPIVQAFAGERRHDQRLHQANSNTSAATLSLTRVQLQFKFWMGIIIALATGFLLWQGGRSAFLGQITVGAVVLFLSYLSSFYTPLASILYTSSTVQSAAGSARRILEVFASKEEVVEQLDPLPLQITRGQIKFDQVTFGYQSGQSILHDVSLEVFPGQIAALVGPTGAGKSTLISLLPRFFDPWAGRILIDGIDIRTVQLQKLRQQVALVLQDPFLFPISIAANIAYGRPDASPAEIAEAAQGACAHEFIEKLPIGYNSVVGERGVTLSGGERQRISIARALLTNAPILVLDEPTSALDIETEQGLMEALTRLMKNRTTLMIAHRLSTVRQANRIFMLEEGRITQNGTHEELLSVSGSYARWYKLQTEAASPSIK
jgi:ATP-binding cassette subfamily B protein/subfamily B ATP-binding cassette protein MsbA